jgi:ABC-type lipoprotein release transport system permease subunit
MSLVILILRSLRFYWRTHLGVLAGVAVTCAILTGALVVGDSVRFSLRQLALARLGRVTHALATGDRFFREKLADETGTVPVLMVRGTVSGRANDVQIVGVDERFWRLGATKAFDGFVLNKRLATQLGAKVGDDIVVRVEPPSWVPRDAPLSGKADKTVAIRGRVSAIAGGRDFGRFSLQANQVPPYTVFVPLAVLQKELKRVGQVNVLLVSGNATDLSRVWTLADSEMVFSNGLLSTSRVFLDSSIKVAGDGVLTYFANEIRLGDKTTPYSFVTAFGNEDGIAINSWLADDLGAKVGDELTLRYYVIGDRRELREESAKFRVSRIIPTEKDDLWMPPFPGLADVEDCRKWEPGIPIALDRIRPKDEAYWKEYRGTPKAFISLAAGQKLWSNRFGNLTAIRLSEPVEKLKLEPPAWVPVREQALRASAESQDFGQLFIGFSFFLIVAALLLTAMLFVFNLEQRREEVGLLRALGFGPRLVRWLALAEGGALALLGTVIGVGAGVAYTKLTLLGLQTVWRGAVGTMSFQYHAELAALAIGVGSSLAVAFGAMWLAQRRQMRNAPVELLGEQRRTSRRLVPTIAVVSLVGAVVLLTLRNTGAFFGAGACLLVAGIGFSDWLLRRSENAASLGLRNAARSRGRSLTIVAVLASGVFLLVAVNAFHQDPQQNAPGTGGFAWYAETTAPVYEGLPGTVPMRVREGDDASCLNLNRAQQPRLLGVRPEELAKRGAFGFVGQASSLPAQHGGTTKMVVPQWELLNQSGDAVPAIGDEATVRWALGKKVGDTLPYTDEHGRTFQLRIVGVLPNSILQGSLVISERNFIEKFPSASGYRVFLMDAIPEGLARTLEDKGFEAVPAWRRLAEFSQVENTYLGIFQALGGLGLLLGSVGLAIVVLRNVMERRDELALLQAVGFERRKLRWLVLSEHWLLVLLGVGLGTGAALVAVWPQRAHGVPVLTLALLMVGGLFWSWLAAWIALRGPLLPALRNE